MFGRISKKKHWSSICPSVTPSNNTTRKRLRLHQSCVPLCLQTFISFMPSHFSSGEPIVFHSFTPPMILYFNPRKYPHLITQHLIQICQVSFIYHCLNFFQQLIQICQFFFINHCLELPLNKSKGPHMTPSVDHSNILSHLYSSLWPSDVPLKTKSIEPYVAHSISPSMMISLNPSKVPSTII